MKITKSMSYYFIFWLIYLPLTLASTFLLKYSLLKSLAMIGIGALILLAFLTVRFVFYKNRIQASIPTETASCSESNIENIMPDELASVFSDENLVEVKNE